MKMDMSREAVTNRLKTVEQLRKLCLSLANSSMGKKIRTRSPNNDSVVEKTAQVPTDQQD